MVNMRNWGTYDDEGTNYTFTVTFYTLDSDGDGWWDGVENDCGTDPNDSNSTPSDYDGDGLCDSLDDDIDNDGVPNNEDAMDFDNTSSAEHYSCFPDQDVQNLQLADCGTASEYYRIVDVRQGRLAEMRPAEY